MGLLVETLVTSIFLSLCFVITESAPKSALVNQLPSFNGNFPSKHYAGYVTIDKKSNKNLYYYFVESERNASIDPVVLWLNGGPGCSSMDGFVYEHGPFNFELRKTNTPLLHLNPYSWSKVSNVIYLDSPVGVGFSYSKDKSDYVTNDTQTASDSHEFLLKMFPEFQSNPFFISGESYAGIYVPTLASEIVKGSKNALRRNKINRTFKKKTHVTKHVINFKGYLIGNGVTDEEFDGNALVPFTHGMALISDEIYEMTKAACKGNYYSNNQTNDCLEKLSLVSRSVDSLNIYNILEPCYHGTSLSASDTESLPKNLPYIGKTERPLQVTKRMFGREWPLGPVLRPGIVPSWSHVLDSSSSSPPCIDDKVASTWLDDPAVRKALHAKEKSEIGGWELCTSKLQYKYIGGSMIGLHRNLTLGGYRALIYSGDHDMCVPYTGSEAWTRSMGYKVIDSWRPWFSNGQVGGFLIGYDKNLTFLTIKGSGHSVPQFKPREALDFYSRFLRGDKI